MICIELLQNCRHSFFSSFLIGHLILVAQIFQERNCVGINYSIFFTEFIWDHTQERNNLSLNSKLSLWEGPHFFERLLGLEALFMGSKSFPDGACLLGAEVQRFVFLALEIN